MVLGVVVFWADGGSGVSIEDMKADACALLEYGNEGVL